MSIVTKQPQTLTLFAEPADWSGLFDQLEVWRSRLGEGGPYELLTAGWSPARLPKDAPLTGGGSGYVPALSGKPLILFINEEVQVEVTFVGTDPITLAAATAQIEAQSNGYLTSYVSSDARPVVCTAAMGLSATLRVVGGDAAPLLGLPTQEPQSVSFGTDPRISLVSSKTTYVFKDPNSSPEYYYKTRFHNSVDGAVSAFSDPFNTLGPTTLSAPSLVRCTLDLVDVSGTAAANRDVVVYGEFGKQLIEGRFVVGGSIRKTTDYTGHVSFLLPRGLEVSVAIGGTNVVRTLTVPTDPGVETISLLDPDLSKEDVFGVERVEQTFAARRSL